LLEFNITLEENDSIIICVLIPNGYEEGFELIGNIIENTLGIKFSDKFDGIDSYYWDFNFEGVEMKLHYHDMIGDIEVFVDKDNIDAKEKLVRIAKLIEKHL